jgi:hypothetical protein
MEAIQVENAQSADASTNGDTCIGMSIDRLSSKLKVAYAKGKSQTKMGTPRGESKPFGDGPLWKPKGHRGGEKRYWCKDT